MTTSSAVRWVRAMNPFIRPRAMAEAQRSARAAGVGMGLSLLAGLPSTLWLLSGERFSTLMDSQYAAMGLTAAELEMQQALMQTVWPYMVGFSLIFTLGLYGALAFIQWRYMTRAIPIVLLGFSIYGAVANIGMRLLGSFPGTDLPLWMQLINWPVAVVVALIYAAALQGALMLQVLKGQP